MACSWFFTCVLRAMTQPSFLDFSALVVKDRDRLKTGMKITAYHQHNVGSFSSLGLFCCKPIYSLHRANVMQSSAAERFARESFCGVQNPCAVELADTKAFRRCCLCGENSLK